MSVSEKLLGQLLHETPGLRRVRVEMLLFFASTRCSPEPNVVSELARLQARFLSPEEEPYTTETLLGDCNATLDAVRCSIKRIRNVAEDVVYYCHVSSTTEPEFALLSAAIPEKQVDFFRLVFRLIRDNDQKPQHFSDVADLYKKVHKTAAPAIVDTAINDLCRSWWLELHDDATKIGLGVRSRAELSYLLADDDDEEDGADGGSVGRPLPAIA